MDNPTPDQEKPEENSEEKPDVTQNVNPPKTRFVQVELKNKKLAYYLNQTEEVFEQGTYVLVESDIGFHMGKVVKNVVAESFGPKIQGMKKVMRSADDAEIEDFLDLLEKQKSALDTCQEQIDQRSLEMKLIDVDYQMDRSKITFFFTAERRVDFRDLVKALAGIFKTRIELRQVGVRDEAMRLDGVGPCGKRLCCSSWLKDFSPITLKMARDQHISLTPSKISGLCGRLLCCLEYEHELYKAKSRLFPPIGTKIAAEDGSQLRVVSYDIFREIVIAQKDDNTQVHIPLADIRKQKK